jgi:hypothetical protein
VPMAAFLRPFRKLHKQQRTDSSSPAPVHHGPACAGFHSSAPPIARPSQAFRHNAWSISLAMDNAVLRVADEVRPGETHNVGKFIGDHDAYDRVY